MTKNKISDTKTKISCKKVLTNSFLYTIINLVILVYYVFIITFCGGILTMQNVELDFVEFDSVDVIVTSGGGYIPTSIDVIWLSTDSIMNYNSFKDGDLDLDLTYVYDEYKYTAYNGLTRPRKNPSMYAAADASDETPPVGLYVVGANDAAGYKAVLDWLTAIQKQ